MNELIPLMILALIIFGISLLIGLRLSSLIMKSKNEEELVGKFKTLPLTMEPKKIKDFSPNTFAPASIYCCSILPDGRVVIHINSDIMMHHAPSSLIGKNSNNEWTIISTSKKIKEIDKSAFSNTHHISENFAIAKEIILVTEKEFKQRIKNRKNLNKLGKILL